MSVVVPHRRETGTFTRNIIIFQPHKVRIVKTASRAFFSLGADQRHGRPLPMAVWASYVVVNTIPVARRCACCGSADELQELFSCNRNIVVVWLAVRHAVSFYFGLDRDAGGKG